MKKFQMILVSSVLSILLLTGCSDDGGTEATKKPVKETTTVSEETTTVNDDTADSDETTTVADETTSSEQLETTSEEVTEVETTTTEPESKTYEVKLPEVNPDWQTASAVTLNVPFVRQLDELKGAGASAIACTSMLFNYFCTTLTQEDIMDDYIELMSTFSDDYTFVDPRTTDTTATIDDLDIIATFISRFYKDNLNTSFRSHATDGLIHTKEEVKESIFNWIREGKPVVTLCNKDLTPNTNAIVVLIVGFNNDNNTVLIADPTKDSISEYNQDEFFNSMYSLRGVSTSCSVKIREP